MTSSPPCGPGWYWAELLAPERFPCTPVQVFVSENKKLVFERQGVRYDLEAAKGLWLWSEHRIPVPEDSALLVCGPGVSPDATLAPLSATKNRRRLLIEISVGEEFATNLDNQWEVEREILADRWQWRWAPEPGKTAEQASPRPWRIEVQAAWPFAHSIVAANGKTVLTQNPNGVGDRRISVEDLKHIVECVNAHHSSERK